MNNKTKIQVEGWRGISHSYALVNQFQLLAWLKDPNVELGHVDKPYFFNTWGKDKNPSGLNNHDKILIDSLSSLNDFDYTYRIYSPFNLKPDHKKRTAIFMVTEFGLDLTSINYLDLFELKQEGGIIITPSNWSKNRLLANGIPAEILNVVPHSVDTSYFYKLSKEIINEQRTSLGYKNDEVILLNVGTQHWAKGLDILIRAFAIARESRKDLRLILKDQRNTYALNTEEFIHNTLADNGLLTEDVINSISLITADLNLNQLNSLYNSADVYVSSYRAEGYNLPVHEAQACGTKLIVTKNGATDDFIDTKNSILLEGIQRTNVNLKSEIPINSYIEPDIEHLVQSLMDCTRKDFLEYPVAHRPSWNDVAKNIKDLILK